MSAFWVGVDGGGTRTRAVVAGPELVPMGRGASGPANASMRPLPVVVETILEAVDDAAVSAVVAAERAEGVGVGLAGVETAGLAAPLTAALEERFGAGRVLVTTDARVALAGASPGDPDGPGVVLIAGTGAIAYGRSTRGEEARAGGWGPLLGDEGSGYAIARQGLAAVVRAARTRRSAISSSRPSAASTASRSSSRRSTAPRAARVTSPRTSRSSSPRRKPGTERPGASSPTRARSSRSPPSRSSAGSASRRRPSPSRKAYMFLGGYSSLAEVAPGARVGPPAYPPEIGAIRLARVRAEVRG